MLSLSNIPLELTYKSDGVYFFKETITSYSRSAVMEVTEEEFYNYLESDLPEQEYRRFYNYNLNQVHKELPYFSSPWPCYAGVEIDI